MAFGPLLPHGSLRVRRERPKHAHRHFRLHKPHWIDPFPQIPGTEPEKRIFEALVKSRIYFRFHAGSPKEVARIAPFEADHDIDFLLPEYRVIIDPFSPFHHSLPDSVRRDARKLALFTAAGYEEYHPWAVAPGVFTLDEPHHQLGLWRGKRNPRPVFHRDRHGNLILQRVPAPGGDLHQRAYGAFALLQALPALRRGPRYPLTDPIDVQAKRLRGYYIGPHLGAGANAVGLANAARRKPPTLTLKG